MATWLSQVKDATAFLKRLYVSLKDGVQRDRADAAGAYARERRGPSGRARLNTPCPWLGLPPAAAERAAWLCVIHGLLGLNILVALGDSSSDGPKAGSLHKRLDRELGIAVRGFATAFPLEMVGEDLDEVCERVIDEAAEVAEAAWSDIRKEEEPQMSVRDFLKDEWLKDVKPSLRRMLDSA
jgi:hypothetical protein